MRETQHKTRVMWANLLLENDVVNLPVHLTSTIVLSV